MVVDVTIPIAEVIKNQCHDCSCFHDVVYYDSVLIKGFKHH
jgi:hypothetical protein